MSVQVSHKLRLAILFGLKYQLVPHPYVSQTLASRSGNIHRFRALYEERLGALCQTL
jgi:hypothetical protein